MPFTAQASDLWGPVALSWNFGDGSAAAAGSSVTHPFAAAGTDTVTVTATDAAGNSAARSGPIHVSAAAPGKAALSHASIKPKRFKAGHRAVFTFRLNEPARVTITLASRHVRKHGKPRFTTVGRLKASGKSGVNHVRFAGRVGKKTHKLKPGRYRATITATAGGVNSKPVSVSFTITR